MEGEFTLLIQDAITSSSDVYMILKTIKHCYSFPLYWLLERNLEFCLLKSSLQAWSVQYHWYTWGMSRNAWASLGHHQGVS